MQRTSKYRPRRTNLYVPGMQYFSGLVHAAPFEVDFGTPIVASATAILGTTSIAVAGSTSTFVTDNTDPVIAAIADQFPYGPGFGRCLTVTCDGTATSNVTIKGRDYLGQPMSESFTLAGASTITGTKAFKWVDLVTFGATSSRNITVGISDKLGLPFRMVTVLQETLDGVNVGTLGTLVTPSRVDPATVTTTDPRGTYDPQSTLTGSARLKATFLPDGSLNAAGNGGLYGLAHFYA